MRSPVVIIGAGRSGTNALRDALCELDGLSTWPCDEINYIWRHGNRDHPTDELLPAHANQAARARITQEFEKMERRSGGDTIIEKTCANSLRVSFVDEVLPEARFVHIIRDGRDAASSAMSRWTAELDVPYLLRKARFVPPVDLPHYAVGYLATRVAKIRSKDQRLGWWGPKFEGMDALRVGDQSLAVVAAAQWAACVERALDQFEDIPSDRVFNVRYESLVQDPAMVLGQIVEFIGAGRPDQVEKAASSIHGGSIGSFRKRLSESDIEDIEKITEPVMRRVAETVSVNDRSNPGEGVE